jgi:ribose transport system permease protein
MKKEIGIAIVLILLCVITAHKQPNFLNAYNLHNQAQLIGMFGIFSMGMGIVIITGGIDLSVGSIFALQGVVLAILLSERHWPWWEASLVAIVGVVALEIIHGLLITKAKLQPFIVTLCGLMIYRSLARYIAHDETKGFGSGEFGWLRVLSTGTVKGLFDHFAQVTHWTSFQTFIDHHIPRKSTLTYVPNAFVIMLILAGVMYVVLHRSVYGRYLYAVGRNEEAAKYSGINSKLVIGSAYAVCGLLTAISGIMFAFYTNSIAPSSHGLAYELYGIAAAVLGGCSLRGGEGSILGIILGTALLQLLQNLVVLLHIDSSLNLGVIGTVILIGALIDVLLGSNWRRRPAATVAAAPAPAPALTGVAK